MKHDIPTPLAADAKSNPRAASVRILAKSLRRAYGQRRHDLRIGKQPDYVDPERKGLNRNLVALRPLPEIQRENNKLRSRRDCARKMKSNAAVVMTGIITFGHEAQFMFACLSNEQQDAAYLELAERIAERLRTRVESLDVHADETADHAHFMLRGYTDDGEPVSKVATYTIAAELQDITAEVMQTYCPDIERGHKKWDRIENGANYADTVNRSVKQLHQDLPREIAAREAELARLTEERVALQASLEKTKRQSVQMEARRSKTAQQLKTARKYKQRLANKEVKLAQREAEMEQARIDVGAMQVVLQASQLAAEERDTAHAEHVQKQTDKIAADNAEIAEEQTALIQMKSAHDADVRNAQAAATEREDALRTKRDLLNKQEEAFEADAKAKTDMMTSMLSAAQKKADQAALARQADEGAAEAAGWQASQAKRDTARACAQKLAATTARDHAIAEKVAAEAATAKEKKVIKGLRADLSADRKFIAEQLNAAQNGINAIRSVVTEFLKGTLSKDATGRVQMADETPFKMAPEWIRSALSVLRKELADVRQEMGAIMSSYQVQTAKISQFLKRDDLTVEAREEAETLRDQNPRNDF